MVFTPAYFLYPPKTKGRLPLCYMIDLSTLNLYIRPQPFKMETSRQFVSRYWSTSRIHSKSKKVRFKPSSAIDRYGIPDTTQHAAVDLVFLGRLHLGSFQMYLLSVWRPHVQMYFLWIIKFRSRV